MDKEAQEKIARVLFSCYQEDAISTLRLDAELTGNKIKYQVKKWDGLACADKAFYYACADRILALFEEK